jgi:hypothetical protein
MINKYLRYILPVIAAVILAPVTLSGQTVQKPSPAAADAVPHSYHDHGATAYSFSDQERAAEYVLICTTIDLVGSEEGIAALEEFMLWRESPGGRADAAFLEIPAVTDFNIGDTRSFRVRNLTGTQQTWDTVQFTLRGKGSLTYVWVANDQFGPNRVTQNVVNQMMVALESSTNPQSYFPEKGIVEINQEIFGNAPDIDESGYLNVLVVDVKDGWTQDDGGAFTGGFFDPVDLNPNNANSNAADIIYIDATPGIYREGVQANPERALSTLAHEYQHLIHANYGSSLNTFMNEGQSEWAELLNGYQGRGPAYLSLPAEMNRFLYSWRSNSADVLFDYQRASLLHSYIAERIGPNETGRLTRTFQSGRSAYELILGPSGLDFENVLGEFHTANWINEFGIDGARFGYDDPRRRTFRVPFGTVPFLPGQTSGEGSREVRYGGTEYVEWIAAENLNFSLDAPDGMVFHLVTSPFDGGQADVTRIQPGNHQINGEFRSVALVATNARAQQNSETSPGVREYTFSSNWTPLPYAIETLSYSGDAEFFAELPGDPADNERSGIQAYSLRISPNITSNIRNVQFVVNNRDSGVIPEGDLRIYFGGSTLTGGEYIPAEYEDYFDVPLGNIGRGNNVVDVSDRNWRVESGNHYHITFEVVNNSGAGRIEFLLDAGTQNENDRDYFPARTRIYINPPSVQTAGWYRYTTNNNILASVDLAGRYDGPSQIPVITNQPETIFTSIGSTVTFTVNFTGVPEPFIQWRKNGESIPGANEKTLTISNVTQADVGNYSVIVTNFAGAVESAVAELSLERPEFQLLQNYPNPFNPSTNIEFILPGESIVSLEIYDITGRRIDITSHVQNLRLPAGRRTVGVTFPNGLASGIYFYRLIMRPVFGSSGEMIKTRKLMLLK